MKYSLCVVRDLNMNNCKHFRKDLLGIKGWADHFTVGDITRVRSRVRDMTRVVKRM